MGQKKVTEENVSDALVRVFKEAGISHAFGLTGGAIAPFALALSKGGIEIIHCRHEGGAGFAALEGYFASGRPGLVFATTGPGVSNALTGLAAARWEGGKLVLVSAASGVSNRGRWAFQETEDVHAAGLFPGAPVAHYSAMLDDASQLPVIASRLAHGLQRPGPFVAHLQLPLSLQPAPAPKGVLSRLPPQGRIVADSATVERLVQLLDGSSFVIWAGFGARDASETLEKFAELTGAPVMCSPRGKGAFPENHRLYLGVTGFGGHAAVDDYMEEHRPDYVLVLGSRLGEMTSLWQESMLPREALIHVDIDPEVFGAAYPSAHSIGVLSDAGELLSELMRRGGEGFRSSAAPPQSPPFPEAPAPRAEGLVRPQVLMAALQEYALDRADEFMLMSEAGNAFAWATHWLRFAYGCKYRVSMGFGSMGHAIGAPLGVGLVAGHKAIGLAGDGAMLMNNEISTAVHHRVPAIWVVLNDAQYGMIRQGMESIGYEPFATEIPSTDFVKMAEAMGAKGIRVRSELELPQAIEAAMREPGPVVVDVYIDPAELAPTRKRNASLLDQGAGWTKEN